MWCAVLKGASRRLRRPSLHKSATQLSPLFAQSFPPCSFPLLLPLLPHLHQALLPKLQMPIHRRQHVVRRAIGIRRALADVAEADVRDIAREIQLRDTPHGLEVLPERLALDVVLVDGVAAVDGDLEPAAHGLGLLARGRERQGGIGVGVGVGGLGGGRGAREEGGGRQDLVDAGGDLGGLCGIGVVFFVEGEVVVVCPEGGFGVVMGALEGEADRGGGEGGLRGGDVAVDEER